MALSKETTKAVSNMLAQVLNDIVEAEKAQDYDKRNCRVLVLLTSAMTLGWNCGIKIDPKEPDWPVVFVELPTGQVSWHLEQYKGEWDGHTTEQKYDRVNFFLEYLKNLGQG